MSEKYVRRKDDAMLHVLVKRYLPLSVVIITALMGYREMAVRVEISERNTTELRQRVIALEKSVSHIQGRFNGEH